VRQERPYSGAQWCFTDADGMRLTCFATNTAGEAIAELELRHRQRARAEDRIRAARATGLRNPPGLDTPARPHRPNPATARGPAESRGCFAECNAAAFS
jgi:hypothetical protein